MPETPRVAITVTQCWHRVPGGTATSIQRLVDALAATEQVDLVGVAPRGELRRPSTWRGVDVPTGWVPDVALARLPLPLPVLYDAWTRLGRPTVTASTGPVDLVHLTVPVTPPRDVVPLVATVHDLFPLTHPQLMTGRGAGLMAAGLDTIRERAVRVVVPSETVARECRAHGFDADRLRVVPWGVRQDGPDELDARRIRDRLGLHGPFVLFLGTLEPRKNLAGLLDALVQLGRPDVTLVVAGPDGWGDPVAGPSGVGLGDVPGPVLRLGYVPEHDLPALQRAADVCCVPSLAEGFGLPVLEAMAAGAAVVTTRDTATGEVGGDGARSVDTSSPTSLAAALGEILDDPDGAADLRSRARARAAEFTWERTARATLAVYDEVLG
ncbi:MAG: glycosyltransferase family 4 protein [Microthrixaceae bacterium]